MKLRRIGGWEMLIFVCCDFWVMDLLCSFFFLFLLFFFFVIVDK